MNTQAPASEAPIRASMDAWIEAVHAKDLDKLMALYAPDVLVFDLVAQLSCSGAENYRQHYAGWFSAWRGPIRCERRELSITAGEDIAFACCLTHNSGVTAGGQKMDHWVRVTIGFRKIDGAWKVTHEHVSAPFDMDTMQACLHLKP